MTLAWISGSLFEDIPLEVVDILQVLFGDFLIINPSASSWSLLEIGKVILPNAP